LQKTVLGEILGGPIILSEISEPKQSIGWREAWRIAGKIAFEVQFRSSMSLSSGAMTQSIERQIEKARSNARFNKITVSFFIAMLAMVFGIIVWGTLSGVYGTPAEYRWITIAFTASIFCLLGFAFLVFWGIMVSTSFISSNAASIGHYLPVSRTDTGKLALLAYVRLFDSQMISIIVGFPLAYGIVIYLVSGLASAALLGSLACFGAFLISVGLAITVMLLLALYFYTRIQLSGGSRLGSIIRLLFIILWAVAIMGFSLSFQLLNIIIPLLEGLSILLAPFWYLLYFGYPFSMGTFIVLATGIPGTPAFWLDFLLVLIYGGLAVLGLRWSLRFLQQIGMGSVAVSASTVIHPVSVKVSRVGFALLRKDIRIATRTPGQAVMFFLPFLTMFPIFLQFLWQAGVFHVSDVIIFIVIPTIMLGFFSIFFLSVEARGMAYTMTLPLPTERILRAKAQLITLMAIAIPVFVIILSFFRQFTNPISFLFAASMIPTVYVSAYISLVLFTRVVGGGRLIGFELGQHITHMIIVGLLSAFLAFIPIALLGVFWFIIFLLGYPVQFAHYAGFAGLWVGIFINYLLGKVLARFLLIN
jgi:predicted permease